MISLAKHIETLLLRHDCVVVPGFGGFITNYVEALPERQEAQTVLYPPYRVVRFNQSLVQSDGLLVGSYMTAYDASFPAAEKQMRKDVRAMVDCLKLEGAYVLENIGTLRMDLQQHVTLETTESGITTPAFYGLSCLEMPSADALEAERQLKEAIQLTTMTPVVPAPSEEGEAGSDVTIHIRRRWVDIAISAAAAVLLFFLFSYPMMREPAADDVVVASPYRPSSHLSQKSDRQAPAAQLKPDAQSAVSAQAPVAEAKPVDQQSVAPNEQLYSIVLASYVAEKSSLEFVADLAKAGFKEGRFERTGRVSRVLYGRYPSAEAANKALKELKEQSKEFAEGWVMEVK